MSLRLSTALRNALMATGSLKRTMRGGVIKIYSGTQPANADAAATGTLLATITVGSGAHTNEVQAVGSVQLSAGASGSVDSILIGMPGATSGKIELLESAVAFNTSLTQTAADVAAAINKGQNVAGFTATSSGDTVTIKAPMGAGANVNAWTVVSSATTITTVDSNLSGGVDSVNGLDLSVAANGSITKDSGQTWSGVNANTGTAGWFRFYSALVDDGSADSAAEDYRIDGSIGTSGADMNLSSTSLVATATTTISTFTPTEPAS